MSADPQPMHEELRDDLAAYALGALPDRDAAEIDRHLAGCDACRDYVRWLQPAVDLVPASVDQLNPPERLRESLMAAVYADHGGESPAAAATPPRTEARAPAWRDWLLRPATALATVAVLVAGAVGGYLLASSDDDTTRTTVPLTSEVGGEEVRASVEYGSGGDAILHVERAPELERGHFYQPWIARDGNAVPTSESFRPATDGSFEVALGDDLSGADAVMITEEPERHSQRPSEALVMRASL